MGEAAFALEPQIVMPQKKQRYAPKPREQEIQNTVVQYLQFLPEVVWVERINSGSVAGFVYCSDIRKVVYGMKNKTASLIISALEGLMKRRQAVKLADKGTADIVGMFKGGRMFAFEVKRPGEKARDDQKEFLARIEKGGGLAAVVTGLDDVMEALKNG